MSIFKGAAVAIITPFNDDLSVNYDEFKKIIDDQINNGTDAIVVCGTTGEPATMTEEEHLDVIKWAIKYINKRVPVIAGTGSNCTSTSIYLSTEAEKAGADALLLVSPYYNKCTQNGLVQHFAATANKVSIPCIIYNVPSRTGCNILPQTAIKLAKEVDNIVAIKEASGDLSQIMKLSRLNEQAGNVIDIYSGNDDQIVPILAAGGIGVISVLSNVAPKQTHEICQKFFDGDVAGSLKLQLDLLDVINNLFSEVNPIPVKAAMNMLGYKAGTLRLPLTEMEDAHKAVLKAAMEEAGIL